MREYYVYMESETQKSTVVAVATPGTRLPHTTRIAVGIFLLGVAAIMAGTFVAVRYYAPATALWSAWTLPSEHQGALFLARGASASAYTATTQGYVPVDALSGKGIVYAAPKDDALFVMADPATATYRIELNGAVLLTSKEPIATAALSPNKKAIVYTKQREGKDGSRDAADWDVVMFYPAVGKSVPVSPGFAPFFIDDTHVARFTNAGIYVIDLMTSTQTELLKYEFKQVLLSFSQSPDHTLIAWSDPVAKSTLVYRVGPSLSRVMAFDGFIPLFVLGNETLYRLQLTDNGTNIFAYSFASTDSARKILTLPASLQISGLSL